MINVEENFNRYIELINSISRPGFKKEEFIKMISNSDFKVAPATMKYHNSVEGGLCDHCLKVYDNLTALAKMCQISVDPDSLTILALMHDLGTINQFVLEPHNVKRYCQSQEEYEANPKAFNKHDDFGTFGWFTELGYGLSPHRLVFGSHESTCEYVARSYIPLRMEESIAILHHTGSLAYDSYNDNIYEIFTKYPLALLLFQADLMTSCLNEERPE